MDMSGQFHPLATLPLAAIKLEAGRVPQLAWTFGREKYYTPARNLTPDCPSYSLVTILTGLSKLLSEVWLTVRSCFKMAHLLQGVWGVQN
jgi:hypothetical protein